MAKRHSPEQIIRKLREAELQHANGQTMAHICQRLGISEQTLIRWRQRYSGVGVPDARRLKELENENGRLKRLVAELVLDKQMLQEVIQKKF